jgi:hypothetical protein
MYKKRELSLEELNVQRMMIQLSDISKNQKKRQRKSNDLSSDEEEESNERAKKQRNKKKKKSSRLFSSSSHSASENATGNDSGENEERAGNGYFGDNPNDVDGGLDYSNKFADIDSFQMEVEVVSYHSEEELAEAIAIRESASSSQ